MRAPAARTADASRTLRILHWRGARSRGNTQGHTSGIDGGADLVRAAQTILMKSPAPVSTREPRAALTLDLTAPRLCRNRLLRVHGMPVVHAPQDLRRIDRVGAIQRDHKRLPGLKALQQ